MGPHSVELAVQPTHCAFFVDEELSGLGPSCKPPLGRQLQHPLRLSPEAFQPDAVLCLANGLADSLQLLTAEDAVHVGVFCNASGTPLASALARNSLGMATAGDETKKRAVPGDAN